MRIIGGKYGGRNIHSPKGLPVRPTTDRTKEALFNVLSHRLDWPQTRVLDLFAGTGNISLECWSRGAASVTSVDKHPRCVAAIKKHKEELGIEGGKVIRMDVRKYVKQLEGPFDLIFMDPPYALPNQESLVISILEGGGLSQDGLLIVEHTPQLKFDNLPLFESVRVYGSSALSFFSQPE